jgi:RNA polymerase sigma-70 factor (ECF subfamily)
MPADRAAPTRSDRDRFESLAMPHLAVLHRVALRLTRNGADAADLVQETFLRAYRTFASFREGTNERAWLFTILYSISANQHRARRRRPIEVSLDAPDTEERRETEIADWSGTERILSNPRLSWEGSEAARALASLPERFRLPVQMIDLEELSYEEAAGVLGCPVGTLRSRLYRGRRRLALALREVARAAGLEVDGTR